MSQNKGQQIGPNEENMLLKMASNSWDLTPIQSNLVEGGHSATNAVMSIGQELAEAVDRCVNIYIPNVDLIFFLKCP